MLVRCPCPVATWCLAVVLLLLTASLSNAAQAGADAQAGTDAHAGTETIAAIQVQGNTVTAEADVLRVAGIQVGMPLTSDTLERVAERLRADRRFVRVEVRKRFASIADPTQVAVVIIVDEGPVTIERNGEGASATARAVRAHGLRLLFLPILRYEEGYGVSYGVRVARTDLLGPKSRVSVPLTWGGERRAALEAERQFDGGPVQRLAGGVAVARRVNPLYRESDIRQRLSLRADSRTRASVRADASAAWEHVHFGAEQGPQVRLGAGVTLDTRVDPWLARNAVFARVAVERLWTRGSPVVPLAAANLAAAARERTININTMDVRGYVGLFGQSVLVVRGFRQAADAPLPAYERFLSGGGDVLRGFRVGYAAGDTLTAGSLELRTPITSPLSFARLGVSLFADTATVYDVGSRMRDQRFDRGVGAGVWAMAAVLRLNVAVARGLGHGLRVSVGATLAY